MILKDVLIDQSGFNNQIISKSKPNVNGWINSSIQKKLPINPIINPQNLKPNFPVQTSNAPQKVPVKCVYCNTVQVRTNTNPTTLMEPSDTKCKCACWQIQAFFAPSLASSVGSTLGNHIEQDGILQQYNISRQSGWKNTRKRPISTQQSWTVWEVKDRIEQPIQ